MCPNPCLALLGRILAQAWLVWPGSSSLARQAWLVKLARLAWPGSQGSCQCSLARQTSHARAMPGPMQGPMQGPEPCLAWPCLGSGHPWPWPGTPLAILACHPWAWQGKGSGSLGLASPAGPASIPPSLPRPCPSLSASLAHLPPLASPRALAGRTRPCPGPVPGPSRCKRPGPHGEEDRLARCMVQGRSGKVHGAGEISMPKIAYPL
jgi:hypothetical protein